MLIVRTPAEVVSVLFLPFLMLLLRRAGSQFFSQYFISPEAMHTYDLFEAHHLLAGVSVSFSVTARLRKPVLPRCRVIHKEQLQSHTEPI